LKESFTTSKKSTRYGCKNSITSNLISFFLISNSLIIGNINEEKNLNKTSQIEKEAKRGINYSQAKKNLIKRTKKRHNLPKDITNKPLIMLIGEENEFRQTIKK
jgi:hypothetical protein